MSKKQSKKAAGASAQSANAAAAHTAAKKQSYKAAILVICAILLISAASALVTVMTSKPQEPQATKVLLETTLGNITIEMAKDMPITTGNFVKLVEQGFYNGVIFHRIIDGFMIQGGDPTGTGMGGPGYKIRDEFAPNNKNNRGTISMANAGPNTGGSQFFINLVNNNFLDTKHPAFGKVVAGMDVVDAIAKVDTDRNDKPLTPVVINKASVIK